ITPRDAAYSQSKDAAMRHFVGAKQNALYILGDLPVARNLMVHAFAHLELDRLPFGVHPIELRAELPRCVFVRRREQIDRRVRGGETSRRVDARSDFESDIYRS